MLAIYLGRALKRRTFLQAAGCGLLVGITPWTGAQPSTHKLLGYLRTNWSQDPFSQGSYSFIAKGAKRKHINALAAPIDNRVFFAGEATHPDYNSTVHAAYESGLIAAQNLNQSQAKNVAIVGAGISGLAAADALEKTGKNVTIFEARDRIGGRIHTDNALGIPLDLGASWIHGINDNPIYAIAQQQRLVTVETDDSYIVRNRYGKEMTSPPEWLDEVVDIEHTAGASLSEVNQFAYFFDDDYDGAEVIFTQGYHNVFETLADSKHIVFNHVLNEVYYNENGVSVGFQNNSTAQFDAVVITIPLGVLKQQHITFSPALPPTKQQAIAKLGMGVLDKVYLQFEDVFWDKDVTWIATPDNGLPRGHFNQWFNLYPYTGKPVIMAFNGGKSAKTLSQLDDDTLIQQAVSTITGAYGR